MDDSEQLSPLIGTHMPSGKDASQSVDTAISLTLGSADFPPRDKEKAETSLEYWAPAFGWFYGILAVSLLLLLLPSVPSVVLLSDFPGAVGEWLVWPVMGMSLWAWPSLFAISAYLMISTSKDATLVRVGYALPWLWLVWIGAVFLLFILLNLPS